MSFSERFELLDLLHEGDVQIFRARERATGRAVEAHFSASPEPLSKLDPARVIDRGSQDGRLYAVTAPQSLDAVGAWRIPPPAPLQHKAPPPGDFTRMFELHQAPEPVATPAAKVQVPVAAQPGELTRAFKKPDTVPASGESMDAPIPGEQGEFTRMFQKPASVPSIPASNESVSTAATSRIRAGIIVAAILIISAIAVFVWMRTLY